MPLYATTLTTLVKNDLPFQDLLFILRQVCNGVKAMHDQLWLHRDIKLENILVDPDLGVVVADFNLVRWACGEVEEKSPKWFRENATTHVCTLWTRAPEVVFNEIKGEHRCEYGKEFDMFSLGSTFISMLVGDYVFGNLIKGGGSTDLIRYITALFSVLGTNAEIGELYGSFAQGMPEFTMKKTRICELFLKQSKYSAEEIDSILDLILGLLHPHPKHRWTWKEVEEWFLTKNVPTHWSEKTNMLLHIVKGVTKTTKPTRPFLIDSKNSVYRKGPTLPQPNFWNLCGVSNIPPFITCEILRIRQANSFSVQESQALLFLFDCLHNYSGEVVCGQISYINPDDIWEVASHASLFDLNNLTLGLSLRKSPFKLCCLATELAITGKCEEPEKIGDSKLIYLSTSAAFFSNYGSLWKSQSQLRQTWCRLVTLNMA
jgi:serine/threonine protein kinase